jgi:hypothetical protein
MDLSHGANGLRVRVVTLDVNKDFDPFPLFFFIKDYLCEVISLETLSLLASFLVLVPCFAQVTYTF